MCGAIPKEESVIVLKAKIALDKTFYYKTLPKMDLDKKADKVIGTLSWDNSTANFD